MAATFVAAYTSLPVPESSNFPTSSLIGGEEDGVWFCSGMGSGSGSGEMVEAGSLCGDVSFLRPTVSSEDVEVRGSFGALPWLKSFDSCVYTGNF